MYTGRSSMRRVPGDDARAFLVLAHQREQLHKAAGVRELFHTLARGQLARLALFLEALFVAAEDGVTKFQHLLKVLRVVHFRSPFHAVMVFGQGHAGESPTCTPFICFCISFLFSCPHDNLFTNFRAENFRFSVKISIPLENTGVYSVFATSFWPFSLIFSLARRNEGNFFQAVPTTLSSSLAEVRLASLVAWA